MTNEVSINLKDIIDNKKIEEIKSQSKENIDSGLNFNVNNNNLPQEIKIKLENNQHIGFIDFDYENCCKPSDSGRLSTNKSESEKHSASNYFFQDDLMNCKIDKNNIMYTNAIDLEDFEENLKNIIFRKNYK